MPRTDRSRGPWLASGLCCPAGSSLTMASSEALVLSRRLSLTVYGGSLPSGAIPELPQFTPRVLLSVPPSIPRRTKRGFDCSPSACASLRHLDTGSASARFTQQSVHAWMRFGAAKFAWCCGPASCSPFTDKGFYSRAFMPFVASWHVEYNYAGKQSIPAAGLPPAGHAALWAARQNRILAVGFPPCNQ